MECKKGTKNDQDKPKYGLLPPTALDDVAKVLTFGSKKYGKDNWKYVDDAISRYFDASQRHLWSYKRGEIVDPESGLPHLAHAIASLLFILEIDRSK